MSAIYGILNLDSRPIEPASLDKMKRAMVNWGPDGSGVWSQGPVGLGHLMLYNTPESPHESLPLKNQTGDIILTASARIDNRADLFHTLQIPLSERAFMADSTLILKAYEKWGTACPNYLLGDWIFALWDTDRHHLFIARDHYGYSGLYYYQDSRTFVFSSSIKGLLALPEVPQHLNPEGLLGPRQWLGHGRASLYEGILRLTPAQSMTVTTSKTDIQHYWHPAEAPDVRFSSDQDYLDAFLDIYTEAVRCRLRSHRPIGVMMSGGLDSGSVATLAARELAPRGQRLFAFSSVPQYATTESVTARQRGDETPAIEAICQNAGNIDVTYVRAENVSPLAGIERILEILGQPMNEPMNLYWAVPLLETARQRGLGTLLKGGGGNLTISWVGDRDEYLRSLLGNRQWLTFIQEIDSWRQVHHASFWRTIRSQVVKPCLPHSWRRSYERLKEHRGLPIHLALARWSAQSRQATTSDPDLDSEKASTSRQWLYAVFNSSIMSPWFEMGENFGQEIRDPTFDKRVLTFCLGIPQNQYTRKGKNRLLIRRAMAGLMPESVLWDDRRGKQAADIIQRVRASQSEIETVLQKLEESALAQQYLDLPRTRDTFETLQHTIDPDLTDRVRFNFLRELMIGLFLQRFEDH